MEGEMKRLRKVAREYHQKHLEWYKKAIAKDENLDQTYREHWALTFSCPHGFYDEDREGEIVGEVKKKKTSKKASPKKARKPTAEKKVLRVIPGGRGASPEAPQ